jgi:hypothetical protein
MTGITDNVGMALQTIGSRDRLTDFVAVIVDALETVTDALTDDVAEGGGVGLVEGVGVDDAATLFVAVTEGVTVAATDEDGLKTVSVAVRVTVTAAVFVADIVLVADTVGVGVGGLQAS